MSKLLHIEIIQNEKSCFKPSAIRDLVRTFLRDLVTISPGNTLTNTDFASYSRLSEHVLSIHFCDAEQNEDQISLKDTEFFLHVYRLDSHGGESENLNSDDDNELSAAKLWPLPSKYFDGLWQSLVFDTNIKEDTLHFVETTLIFSDANVNTNIINFNRVLLFHGPPGTGKTSLCKALAQKLSIRLGDRYQSAILVEINSHSLFSKWFSESGKLVLKLFNKIKELLDDSGVLVCVLIDEVESLTHARKAAMAGSEPSDSVRVVNAVLTQIDQIKNYPNVLILTTSNMSGMIDLAFVDRADLKQYVGMPSELAIYEIYYSCIHELMRAGIIEPSERLFSYLMLKRCKFTRNESTASSHKLLRLARLSKGISGRGLRKIPFLAHALFIRSRFSSIEDFLVGMYEMIKRHKLDTELFTQEMGAVKISGDSRNESDSKENGW